MSYTILYRSMFVQMSDGRYIPLVEMGDNNVYDISWNGHQRRSRSWQQWVINQQYDKLAFTRSEIMNEVERVINIEKEHVGKPYADYEHKEGVYTEQEIEKNWGYYSGIAIEGKHCNNTSAQQVRNFFLKGFDQAISFDDPDLELDLYWCTEYPHWEHRYAKSEQELLQLWEELKAEKRNIWIGYRRLSDYLWNKYRKKLEKKPKEAKTVGFVVQFGYRYVEKMTPRHLHYTAHLEYAFQYASRNAAEKVVQRIKTRYTQISETPFVIPVRKNGQNKWEKAA